jgi:hypothetical protein
LTGSRAGDGNSRNFSLYNLICHHEFKCLASAFGEVKLFAGGTEQLLRVQRD